MARLDLVIYFSSSFALTHTIDSFQMTRIMHQRDFKSIKIIATSKMTDHIITASQYTAIHITSTHDFQ